MPEHLLGRRRFLLGAAALSVLSGCGGTVGYALRPDTIRPGRQQPLRLAIATLDDVRPDPEKDFGERIRLVGDDEARGYTDLPDGVSEKVSDVLAKHLAFAGCFSAVDRVPLESDEQIDLLKIDIRKLSRDYDAVLIGSISHLYGFDGTNAEGDRRIVEAQAHLTDLKIIRTRDLKLIWSGQAVANFREFESQHKGNQYKIANETLRDAINGLVANLSKQRLAAR
jgi:hypothetical protein